MSWKLTVRDDCISSGIRSYKQYVQQKFNKNAVAAARNLEQYRTDLASLDLLEDFLRKCRSHDGDISVFFEEIIDTDSVLIFKAYRKTVGIFTLNVNINKLENEIVAVDLSFSLGH